MNLDPVSEALMADARRDAEELRAATDREAGAVLVSAHRESERLLATARADGEAEARAVAAAELARARRLARELVLAARRESYERLRVEARRAASRLQGAPGYAALVDGLADLARRQLGADVVVTVDDTLGGVVANAGSRSVDYRLPIIADRCARALGAELETW